MDDEQNVTGVTTRSQRLKRQINKLSPTKPTVNSKKQKVIGPIPEEEDTIKINDFKDIMGIIFKGIPEILQQVNNNIPQNIYLEDNYSESNNSKRRYHNEPGENWIIEDEYDSEEDYSEEDYSEESTDNENLEILDRCQKCNLCKKCDNIGEKKDECKKCNVCEICQIPNGRKIYSNMIYDNYFKELNEKEKIKFIKLKLELEEYNKQIIPIKYRILNATSNILNIRNKSTIMDKITEFEYLQPCTGEYNKLKKWIDGISKIPFGQYAEIPVNINSTDFEKYQFLCNVHHKLEQSIYGQIDAKNQILQIISQWISNPQSKGNVIALQGPPGIGKTTLIKNGLSSALNIPCSFITLGGASDASILEGHSYTYEGSMWGRVVDILMQTKCMNPIIIFDELDKISDTPKGQELIGILMHLVDPTQNDQFHDVYFAGVDFDLSKALFIFSYNDENLINPILQDRITKVKLEGFDVNDKVNIAKNYLIPDIINNIGLNNDDIVIPDTTIRFIINNYVAQEKGVRRLKETIGSICNKINLLRFTNHGNDIELKFKLNNFQLPIVVDEDVTRKLLETSAKKDNTSLNMMYM